MTHEEILIKGAKMFNTEPAVIQKFINDFFSAEDAEATEEVMNMFLDEHDAADPYILDDFTSYIYEKDVRK